MITTKIKATEINKAKIIVVEINIALIYKNKVVFKDK